MNKQRDYEKDLFIDPEQLDVEWITQSTKFMHYAQLSVEANDRLRKVEEKIKVIRSELTLEANERGEEVLGKGVKPTAPNVEAYYRNHPRHQEAKKEWLEASFEAEMLQNAVFAFQQRKMALENLARLHGQQYFSGPKEPRDLSEAYREQMREQHQGASRFEVQAKIQEKLNPTEEPRRTRQRNN